MLNVVSITLFLAVSISDGFYLPGVAPREFKEGDSVQLKVDKLTSVRSQLPYSFYHLPFCTPSDSGLVDKNGKPLEVENVAENLGEVLAGDRMESTGYQLNMQEHSPGCQILCRKEFDTKDTNKLTNFIDKEYRVNMWVDNLPAAQKLFSSRTAMEADVKRMEAMKKGQAVDTLSTADKESFMYSRGYLVGQKYLDPSKENEEEGGMKTNDVEKMFSTQNKDDNTVQGAKGPDANGLLPGQYFINNHLQFLIRYHTSEAPSTSKQTSFRGAGDAFDATAQVHDGSFEGARIVGFEVVPVSVHHEWNGEWKGKNTYLKTCNMQNVPSDRDPLQLLIKGETSNEVVFTYTTVWYKDSATKWSERWDIYFDGTKGETTVITTLLFFFANFFSLLIPFFFFSKFQKILYKDSNRDNEIHWFSIFNSLLIVLFLSAMVAMILTRSLYRDIAAYNDETADELAEETGWKLVHGDVFRPPTTMPMLLSVVIGCGNQLLLMTLVMLIFACLGFLSPANRGGLLTALLLLFIFAGTVSGYKSSRIYKLFDGKSWKTNALLSAFLLPGCVFVISFMLNLLVWARQSTSAMPFTTLIALVLLWFGISVPLTFIGSYFGFSKAVYELPCKSHQIPRQIPEQVWFMHPIISMVIGGLLPFGAIFIEIFFIMSALWMHTIYYVFGFLLVVLIILIISCAEISIVMCYFQLCGEDYNWWWRSFGTCAR
jgi:transmembrane 9 superfamily protein 2/4